jgi:hypothetical protein
MEHLVKKIGLLFLLSLALSSCDNLDVAGFLLPTGQYIENRTEESLQWNEQNGYETIHFPTDTYRMCIAGDSHVGTTKNLEKMLLTAADANTYAASVIAGDLTTGKAGDYEKFNDFIERADFGKTKLILGNHDLYFNGWESYRTYFHSSVYYFIVATPSASDLHICLDSGNGTLGVKQLNWLINVLSSMRGNYRYCFIYSHTNLFKTDDSQFPTGNMPLEETYQLMNIFATNNVTAVFTGHDHYREELTFNKVRYVTLDAISDLHPTPSYVVLTCGDTFSYKFIDL